ncbi:amidase family protein [Streptococcus agalactiae]|uniref:amidase family protein n=1 Tax=Streptococcus agalactiae TaxID=1311 RepID=UPI0002F056D8|nr:amidase family protein [Streptococcus agalactiae]EPW90479.1 amidase [Streptococcus agalactiae MRI Z1-022]
MKRKYFILNTVTVLTLAAAMNTSSIYANSTETSASVVPTTNTIVQTNDSNPTAKFVSESGQSVIGQVKPDNSAALTTVDTPHHISAPDALKTTQSSPVVESTSTKLTEETYKQKDGQDLANMVRSGQVTSEELVNMAYDIIAKENPSLNAVITTRRQEAIEEARKLKDTNQPFLGVPLLVKGLGHSIKGGETNNGLIYADGKISTFDSSYVKKYKDLGFIILGQTNFPEYGWRNITDSKLYGLTHNPWDLAHNAGGSSGGSAAAIASGMTPIASGSDAGGSISIPTYLSESGLPIGTMLMAGANYDMVLIKFATFFEKHHGFNVKWQRIIDKEVKPSTGLIQPTNSLFKAHSSLVNLEENSQVTQVSISKKWMKSSVKNKPSVMAYQKALPKTGDTESSLSPVLVVTLLLACFSFVTKKNQKS